MTLPLRLALAGIVIAFLGLFVLSTFVPPPDAERERARRYFSDDEISAGWQYAFQRNLLFWAHTALELGLLLALVTTRAARTLADRFGRWTGYLPAESADGAPPRPPTIARRTAAQLRWLATLLVMAATYFILRALVEFPVDVGRFFLSRAWGMTERSFADWLGQYGLAIGVSAVAMGIAIFGLYVLLRFFPRTWYLLATIGAALFGFTVAFLLPVVIAPLFNTFTPLAQTPWAEMEPMVRALAEKENIPVDGIYVMDASRQGSHTNAYFTGLGSTHRIVLFDTLLKKHPPAEVESILAHEIGHWKHQHIVKGVLLGTLAALVGFILLDRVLRASIGRPPLHLTERADPAGLPLIILLGFLGTWASLPLQNIVSRHFEEQADATSLQLAGMPDVFIRAEQRLAHDNKSNVVPAPWNVWLFATHPPAIDRIEMAEEWKRTHAP